MSRKNTEHGLYIQHRFVEKRVDELEQQEAAALAAALAAASTLPSYSLPPRRYTAGVISPRLGSPTYLASKGFGSFSGMSASERDSEWHTAGAAARKVGGDMCPDLV